MFSNYQEINPCLALNDDDTHENVANEASKEEEKVEDSDEDQDLVVLNLLRSKDILQALEYLCLVQQAQVAGGL